MCIKTADLANASALSTYAKNAWKLYLVFVELKVICRGRSARYEIWRRGNLLQLSHHTLGNWGSMLDKEWGKKSVIEMLQHIIIQFWLCILKVYTKNAGFQFGYRFFFNSFASLLLMKRRFFSIEKKTGIIFWESLCTCRIEVGHWNKRVQNSSKK